MLGSASRRTSGVLLATAALTLVACERPIVPPIELEPGRLMVSANVTATNIKMMVVTVNGPGIEKPLVFNMPVTVGTDGKEIASGSILIPAGSNRELLVEAYDASQIKTHRSEKVTVATVKPGTDNASLTIILLPIAGGQPVRAEFGVYVVKLTPASATLIVGQTQTFTVRVEDDRGNTIAIDAAKLQWATSDPSVFSAASNGLATALATARKLGRGDIVVTYDGYAATAPVTVQ